MPVYPLPSAASIISLIRSLFSGGSGSARKVTYSSDGRSGYVNYQSPEARFSLYYEFGGGDVVACINIPDVKHWQKDTGLPVGQRDEILNFIGTQVARDQTRGGSFKIEGNWMNIYENRT